MYFLVILCLLPPELQAVKDRREQIATAHIDWTLDYGDYQERIELRVAGGTRWERNLGDRNGFHPKQYQTAIAGLKTEEGVKSGQTQDMYDFMFNEPQHRLLLDGSVWNKQGSSMAVDKYPPRASEPPIGFADWGLGTTPRLDNDPELGDCFSSQNDSQKVISCKLRGNSEMALEWVLDTSRDSQPIRCALRNGDDELVRWSQTELTEVDGRWMPSSVEFHRKGENAPYEVLTVEEASFDQDWHRTEPYHPSDLDIGFGHYISATDGGKTGWWDGESILSNLEFQATRCLNDMPFHPDVVRNRARIMGKSVQEYLVILENISRRYKKNHAEEYAEVLRKRAARERDDWDIYVDEFIEEHELVKPKQGIAARILGRAKTLRDIYRDKQTVSSEQEEYDAIEKRIFERMLVKNLKRLK